MVDPAGEDIDERWMLRAFDRVLLGNKTGTTRLGFAVLLKMFQAEGRFPSRPEEVPVAALGAHAATVDDHIPSCGRSFRPRAHHPNERGMYSVQQGLRAPLAQTPAQCRTADSIPGGPQLP